MSMQDNIKIVHSNKTYKLVITDELESKIRFMCSISPDNEWSGVLFYSIEGDMENHDNNLTVIAEDFCLCDVGSSAYTEFETKPEVVNYMCVNDLIGKYMGLIHSHDKMATFFSGTDISTLVAEGSSMLHFVSLIVNNAGEYTAAITKKVTKTFSGTSECSYKTFDGKTVVTTPESMKFETSYIEYYDLNIEFSNQTMYYYLRDRYKEVCSSKSKITEVRPLSSILKGSSKSKKETVPTTKTDEPVYKYEESLFPEYDNDFYAYNYGYDYDGAAPVAFRPADDILKKIFNWGKTTYTKTLLEVIKECERKKKGYKNNSKFIASLGEKVFAALVDASKEDGIINGDREEYLSYLAGECMDALESYNLTKYSVVNDVMDLLNEY